MSAETITLNGVLCSPPSQPENQAITIFHLLLSMFLVCRLREAQYLLSTFFPPVIALCGGQQQTKARPSSNAGRRIYIRTSYTNILPFFSFILLFYFSSDNSLHMLLCRESQHPGSWVTPCSLVLWTAPTGRWSVVFGRCLFRIPRYSLFCQRLGRGRVLVEASPKHAGHAVCQPITGRRALPRGIVLLPGEKKQQLTVQLKTHIYI